jgi:hypothetical protein
MNYKELNRVNENLIKILEEKILILEEVSKSKDLINDELKEQFSLNAVSCSLPSKEAMYFKELEEYKVEKLWDDRINRRDFAKGFISCYKWITNQEFKVR